MVEGAGHIRARRLALGQSASAVTGTTRRRCSAALATLPLLAPAAAAAELERFKALELA